MKKRVGRGFSSHPLPLDPEERVYVISFISFIVPWEPLLGEAFIAEGLDTGNFSDKKR